MPKIRHVEKAKQSKRERRCHTCGNEIQPGEPYKWAKARRGFTQRYSIFYYWCKDHSPEKYQFVSNPKTRLLLETQDALDEALAGDFDEEAAVDALTQAGESLQELAELHRESAENIREGFGHDTVQSEEFDEVADEIENTASDLQNMDLPSPPDSEPGEEPFEPDHPSDDLDDYDSEEEMDAVLEEHEYEYESYREELDDYEALVNGWEYWRGEVRALADEKIGEVSF